MSSNPQAPVTAQTLAQSDWDTKVQIWLSSAAKLVVSLGVIIGYMQVMLPKSPSTAPVVAPVDPTMQKILDRLDAIEKANKK